MSTRPTFNNPSEFVAHLHEVDDEHRTTLISDLFQESVRLLSYKSSISHDLASSQRRSIELETVVGELRRELAEFQRRLSDLLQSSAVADHKLAEAQNQIKESLSQLTDLSNNEFSSAASLRSELFWIDEKFSGGDKTLYPSFKKQIRIALSSNSDRYKTLQSQVSLIYQNLGPGPKSFVERHLGDDSVFNFGTLSEAWGVLDVFYSNPNEEEEARDGLSRLRQGSQPFGTFLSEFLRLQNLLGVTDCKVLISIGIKQFATSTMSTTAQDLVTMTVKELDDLLDEKDDLEKQLNELKSSQLVEYIDNELERDTRPTEIERGELIAFVYMVQAAIGNTDEVVLRALDIGRYPVLRINMTRAAVDILNSHVHRCFGPGGVVVKIYLVASSPDPHTAATIPPLRGQPVAIKHNLNAWISEHAYSHLDWKNLGPFRIAEVVSSHSYRLYLPEDLNSIHPVFHTSLLRPDPGNPLPGQSNAPNPPIEVDEFGEDLFEVDAVIGSRRHKSRGFEYHVKYTGDMKTLWQPLPDIVSGNLSESLSIYYLKHPRRPKPSSEEIAEARAAARAVAKVSTQLPDPQDST
ncbi:hypothetical protein K3495_g5467 [Podosphaera aphanis]|nr:hypothetical protein K3495_g5467 [Podosphaera aphanis]